MIYNIWISRRDHAVPDNYLKVAPQEWKSAKDLAEARLIVDKFGAPLHVSAEWLGVDIDEAEFQKFSDWIASFTK